MKWDKMIAKDAALVHLFLNSEVLGLQLPTAWHVHTVTFVFALGELHLFSSSNALTNNAKRLIQPLASSITNFSSIHKTHSSKMDYPEDPSWTT